MAKNQEKDFKKPNDPTTRIIAHIYKTSKTSIVKDKLKIAIDTLNVIK